MDSPLHLRRRRVGSPGGSGSPGSRSSPREERRKERAQAEAFREQYYAQVGHAASALRGPPVLCCNRKRAAAGSLLPGPGQASRWCCLFPGALSSQLQPRSSPTLLRLQGVSYGKPAACIMYDLAYHLGQENAHMLWLALVGLTDHLVHGRISGGCWGALSSGVALQGARAPPAGSLH